MAFPEELINQFRTVALERLDRVENAWASVIGALDEHSAVLVHRELHTLKGESKMLGFSDVNLVCHKLEDLLELARARGYSVDVDFDLAVNMALRFMAMLVRKKVGAQLTGIDLPGFIRQIDSLLIELRPQPRLRTTTGQVAPIKSQPGSVHVPQALRSRLGPVAVDAFVEYVLAHGARRERLRASWYALRDLVGIHRAVIGPNQLMKHKAGALALARELGKQVDIVFELPTTEVTAEILAALDTALLHLVRNALDHGIEAPADRVAAGKTEKGMLRLHGGIQGERFTLSISDDGRGIALDEVRARAIELGLIKPDDVDLSARWLDLVCQPGFSTRSETSDVSGRGVGLDVVRNGVIEAGGTLTAKTIPGAGTTWSIEMPIARVTFEAILSRAPGLPFPLVVESSWKPLPEKHLDAPIVDVAFLLGVTEARNVENVRYFERDGRVIGLAVDRALVTTSVRRLVPAPAPATTEVVVIDTSEGVLVHLDRMVRI